MFHRPPVFHRAMAFIVLSGFAAAATFSSQAQQRNPDQLIGQTVLDAPATTYRFERFVVESADGQRRWRLNLGVPVRPSTGLAPVLYALDGNAVAMVLDPPLLAELAASPTPPVLVLIGYDNERRIDSAQRTRDYTAWIDQADDERGQRQMVGGGAQAFLDIIERQVKPEVARRASIDPQRQALWGHSLGGLFVLSSLYTRPTAFQHYVAASPSLWWSQGAPLGEMEAQFIGNSANPSTRLWIMLGGDERSGNRGVRDMANPRVVAHLRRVGGAPPDAAHALAGRLAAVPGLQVQYREFPGLGHGPMLPASFKATLAALYGIVDHSAATRGGNDQPIQGQPR